MNKKILFLGVLAILPCVSQAAIPYRVQGNPVAVSDNETYASRHRLYIAGAYNFSLWQPYTDSNDLHVNGRDTSSFEGSLGYRVTDIFRLDANYVRNKAQWSGFSLDSNAVFLNALFDARIDSMYRLFHSQIIVPYVGLGAGASWNKAKDIEITEKVSPVFAGLAGISFEFGEHFAFDFGYRYQYMLSPKFAGIDNLRPNAHQFRGGIRLSF